MKNHLLEDPDELKPATITAPVTGIKRLNRKGIAVLGGILSTGIIVSTYTFNQMGQAGSAAARSALENQGQDQPPDFQRDVMWYANAGSENTESIPVPSKPEHTEAPDENVQDVPDLSQAAKSTLSVAAPSSPNSTDSSELSRQRETEAMNAPLSAATDMSFQTGSSPNAQTNSAIPTSDNGQSVLNQLQNLNQHQQQGLGDDPNKQERKEKFLKEARLAADPDYHKEFRKEPISENEVKAGTVIPSVMISGINSDLPGQVIAQVRENVYDTRSGRNILIPQGSRLIGTYDSQVAYGQERILLAWNRIIFPDASSIALKGMPGTDNAGYAGFHDQVDNHYGRIFGSAILLSLITTGVTASQKPVPENGKKDTMDLLKEALAIQLGQTTQQMTQKNLNIQPTLQIRPGYQFNIMVTADLILPPVNN